MDKRLQGDWMSTSLTDMFGREFKLGDRYVKACTSGRAVNLELCTVSRIESGNLYGNGSHVNVKFPGRCLIVNEVIDSIGFYNV